MKDFDSWNNLKKIINNKDKIPLITEGDIWWCNIGKNIGIESNGKNKNFGRPVLIIKKHNIHHIIVVPTTSQKKYGKFYYKIKHEGKTSYLLLSQIKTLDVKRLYQKMYQINELELSEIKKAIINLNFG